MDKLPTELKLEIFSHLPITDLATLACMDPEFEYAVCLLDYTVKIII